MIKIWQFLWHGCWHDFEIYTTRKINYTDGTDDAEMIYKCSKCQRMIVRKL